MEEQALWIGETGAQMHMLRRAGEARIAAACLGYSCEIHFGSTYAVQREVIRDQAGKMGWSRTVAIVSTMQRVVLKSAGSTHPLKEGRV